MPWSFILTAVLSIATYIFTPRPKTQNATASSLDDISFPTNNNGRPIPEVFGTVEVSGNVIWYGDLSSREIRSRG